MPFPCDIVVEKDVMVKMRDGVSLCVDIFRSATDERVKVPVLISWSSYGKDNGTRPSYDTRGITKSECSIYTIGSHEANDGYDLIEWLGVQDWCNGKVALSGISYLAFSQWFIASTRLLHLAAEGLKYPLASSPIWQDKIAHPERITCPAYIVAICSSTLTGIEARSFPPYGVRYEKLYLDGMSQILAHEPQALARSRRL